MNKKIYSCGTSFMLALAVMGGLADGASATTLNEALAASYRTSPDLKSAIQELQAVDEEMPAAISGMLPTASAEVQRGKKHLQSGTTDLSGLTSTKSIQVTEPLFKGGRTYSNIKKANNEILAQREKFRNTEQQILLGAVEAYMNVVRDKEVFELAKNNKTLLENHLTATKARFELGEVTQTDVSEAKAALAKANSELISAERAYESSKATYKKSMGEEAVDISLPKNAIKINGNIDELVEIALANNPAIKYAQYTLDASKNDVNVKKSVILPQISAFANKEKQEGVSFNGAPTNTNVVGVTLSVPLYQGGAEYADVRKAKHIAGRDSYNLSIAQNNVREAVIKAYEDFKVAQSLIESNQASVDAYSVALEGTTQESYAGLRTTIDVLDAQQALFEAKSNLISSHRDEIVSSYALIAQLGKLTAQELGLKVDIYNPEKNAKWKKFQIIGF